MRKSNILFIPDLLRWKISKKWSTVVILLLVALCMAVHTAENLSSFLFAATAVSVLLAVTSILWIALPPCLLNWLTSSTDTVSSPLMKISVIFSFRTDLCFLAFFILLPALFPACSLKWTNPRILLLVTLWFFILLAGILNGILTFTVWFLKVATRFLCLCQTESMRSKKRSQIYRSLSRSPGYRYIQNWSLWRRIRYLPLQSPRRRKICRRNTPGYWFHKAVNQTYPWKALQNDPIWRNLCAPPWNWQTFASGCSERKTSCFSLFQSVAYCYSFFFWVWPLAMPWL